MMEWLKTALKEPTNNKILGNKLFHREKIFDDIQKEIVVFIGHLMTGTLSHDITDDARKQLRMADEYETISDYIVIILKLRCKMRNNEITLHDKDAEEIVALHDAVNNYLQLILENLKIKNQDAFSKMQISGEAITAQFKDIRNNHLTRLSNNESTPLASLIFMDTLQSYRRIKDHAFNIAEALSGEK